MIRNKIDIYNSELTIKRGLLIVKSILEIIIKGLLVIRTILKINIFRTANKRFFNIAYNLIPNNGTIILLDSVKSESNPNIIIIKYENIENAIEWTDLN